jgi:hypothetical protein
MVVFATVGGDENEIVKVEVKKATVCFFEDLSIKLAACAIFARRSVQPSPAAAAARGRSAITFPFRLHLLRRSDLKIGTMASVAVGRALSNAARRSVATRKEFSSLLAGTEEYPG